MIVVKAIEAGKSFEGATIRDQLEKISNYNGAFTVYSFSDTNHYGVSGNPYYLMRMVDGKAEVVR